MTHMHLFASDPHTNESWRPICEPDRPILVLYPTHEGAVEWRDARQMPGEQPEVARRFAMERAKMWREEHGHS